MTADEILNTRDHRPFPLPDKPWVMRQEWHDLLFAHWALDPDLIRPLVPVQLPLDLWQGRAYIAVAPFLVRALRLRGMPGLPGTSNFSEVNVRTYVTVEGKPGVYFFSLDASSLAAVLGARMTYRLPYYHARMKAANTEGRVGYTSRRAGRKKRTENPELCITYSPSSDVLSWAPPSQSLERFLAERYCLYNISAGRIYRAHIHHLPWPLQSATAEIHRNTMTAPLGIHLDGDPLLHFSRFLDVLVWSPEQVRLG